MPMPQRREPALDKAKEGHRAITVLLADTNSHFTYNNKFKALVKIVEHAKANEPFPFGELVPDARRAFERPGHHHLVDRFFAKLSMQGSTILPMSTFQQDKALMTGIMRPEQVLKTVGAFVDEDNLLQQMKASWEDAASDVPRLRAALYFHVIKMWQRSDAGIMFNSLFLLEVELFAIYEIYLRTTQVDRRNPYHKVVVLFCYALKAFEHAARLLFPQFNLDNKQQVHQFMEESALYRPDVAEMLWGYNTRITSLAYVELKGLCADAADALDALGDRLKKTSAKLRTVTDFEMFQPPQHKFKMIRRALADAKSIMDYHDSRISAPAFVAFENQCLQTANALEAQAGPEEAEAIQPVVAALRDVRLLKMFVEPEGQREKLHAALQEAEILTFAMHMFDEYMAPPVEDRPPTPIPVIPSGAPQLRNAEAIRLIDGDQPFALAEMILQEALIHDEMEQATAAPEEPRAKAVRTARRRRLQKAARQRDQEQKAHTEHEVSAVLNDLLGAVCVKVITDRERKRREAEAAKERKRLEEEAERERQRQEQERKRLEAKEAKERKRREAAEAKRQAAAEADAILEAVIREIAAELLTPMVATNNAQAALLTTATANPAALDPAFLAKFMQIYAPSLTRFARDEDGIDPLIGACQVCLEPFNFGNRKPFYLKCCAQANCGECIQAIIRRPHGQHKLEFEQNDPLVHQWVVLRKELGLPVPRYDQ